MPIQDTNRRLSPKVIQQDLDAYHGLQTIEAYAATRPEASSEAIKTAYETMLAKQQEETEKQTLYKAAADAARLAEYEFHNAVLAMKETVKGLYGSDSTEAAAVGYKKKSERKRPTRTSSNNV
jgi:hypothetical protein